MAAIEVRKDIPFAGCGGQPFKGVLYRPAGVGPHPVLVAVHGGGWKRGSPDSYAVLGPGWPSAAMRCLPPPIALPPPASRVGRMPFTTSAPQCRTCADVPANLVSTRHASA